MAKHFGDRIAESILQAGESFEKNVQPEDVDLGELQEGVHVEMEHTSDPALSMKIGLDHLAEEGGEYYYTGLSVLEQIMKDGHLDDLLKWAEDEFGIRPKLRKLSPNWRRALGISA